MRQRHTLPAGFLIRVEVLEGRTLMAAALQALVLPEGLTLLDPSTVPQFVNDITAINPFVGFNYVPDASGNHYTVGAYQIQQDVLGLKDAGGSPLLTTLFGYGPDAATATYPGRTFEVQQGSPVAVTWVNGLPTKHVVNIDPTLLDEGMPGMGIDYDPLTNEIPQGIPFVPHLHGGHTDAIYDGTPMQWWTAGGAMGEDYVDTRQYNPTQPPNTFTYRNDQQAATLWYHDHAMGVTRLNAYAGMAGFYIIRNEWDTGEPGNPLGLPAGPYEMGLAIQDKQFLSDGELWFPADGQTWEGTPDVASTLPEMFGDVFVVNGKAWPKMNVEARRYRMRLVNASDSASYTLRIAAPAGNKEAAVPIWQIGTDEGLLNTAVKMEPLILAPGERADVILDFTKFKPGTRLVLTNSAPTPFPNGAKPLAGLTDRIMAFDVVTPTGVDASLPPAQLVGLNRTDPVPAPTVVNPTRDIALYETLDEYGRVTPLLGTPESSFEFLDPITENIRLGDTEVWRIYNNTADTHPIHLHQVSYQVLTRQAFSTKLVELGTSPSEHTTMWGMAPGSTRHLGAPRLTQGSDAGWKDTIQINPGEVITVRATFDLPGKYVTHCHILSHEEHDMMRYMQVGADAFPAPGVVVDDTGVAVPPADTIARGLFAAASPFSGKLIDSESEEDPLLALLG